MSLIIRRINQIVTLVFLAAGSISIIYSIAILHQGNPIGKWPDIQYGDLGIALAYLGASIGFLRRNKE